MKAIRVHEYGDADHLKYDQVPIPEPRLGEIRVKVEVVGLNFIEIYQRRGLYPMPLPFTPGGEFAGIVEAVGPEITDFHIGDRVATASGRGAYAQFAIAPVAKTIKIPEKVTTEQAAAVMLQGITAHYLAMSTYPLKAGETALIHAAAGGVGQLLVQLAKNCGARVLGTTSSEGKAKIAREVGVDEVILYSQVDFSTEVKRLTEGKGVDVVYDGVGGATFDKSLDCLKPRGMMVLFGQASGPVEPLNPQVLNQKGSLFLTRPSIGHYLQTREEFLWRANDLFEWMKAGNLKVSVDKTFSFKEAAAAHRYIEGRTSKGKVLLIPGQAGPSFS